MISNLAFIGAAALWPRNQPLVSTINHFNAKDIALVDRWRWYWFSPILQKLQRYFSQNYQPWNLWKKPAKFEFIFHRGHSRYCLSKKQQVSYTFSSNFVLAFFFDKKVLYLPISRTEDYNLEIYTIRNEANESARFESPSQPSFGGHATLRPKKRGERCVTSKRRLRRRLARFRHFTVYYFPS